MSKMEFSCGASQADRAPRARQRAQAGGVVGMEAHVCVFQTVRDSDRRRFSVFVAQDAVISRSEANRGVGLRLCEKAGATLNQHGNGPLRSAGRRGTPEFKELTALIK